MSRRARPGKRSLVSWIAGIAAVVLVVFHAVLFAERLRDFSILQPGVALQWIGTLLLLAFLVLLKRRSASLFRGRTALAFWLLVLLLHLVPSVAAVEWDGAAFEFVLVPTHWVVAAALMLATLLATLRLGAPPTGQRGRRRQEASYQPTLADRAGPHLFARPPPRLQVR